jgi:hypothetical protein
MLGLGLTILNEFKITTLGSHTISCSSDRNRVKEQGPTALNHGVSEPY